jgi:transposase
MAVVVTLGSLAGGVKVAIDKYVHHLPFERQVRFMALQGLTVTSQALWDQIWSLADLMRPVHDALREHVLGQRVIGLDQTGWPNLGQRGAPKWQMWALTSPGAVYHTIHDDKSAATFVDLVGAFEGTIVCDALGTHGAGARDGPGIALAGCWAHIRRRFGEAEPNFPEAREMLDLIRELYDIDARAEGAEHRAELRRTASRDVLKQMRAWMAGVVTIGSTDLGSAIKHTMKYWDRLPPSRTTPTCGSTTTAPSGPSAAQWSGAAITSARSRAEAPRPPPSSTASSRAPRTPTSTPPPTSSQPPSAPSSQAATNT